MARRQLFSCFHSDEEWGSTPREIVLSVIANSAAPRPASAIPETPRLTLQTGAPSRVLYRALDLPVYGKPQL